MNMVQRILRRLIGPSREETHKDVYIDQKIRASQQKRQEALDAIAQAPLRNLGRLYPEKENWKSQEP